jgi:ketosteroid isomerase-like protein
MATPEQNKATVVEFMKTVSKGDVPGIIAAYAEDGYCETMGRTLISGRFSREEVAMAAGRIFEAFPAGVEFTLLNLTAEEDRVAVEATSQGTHVSGQQYANHYHFLFRLRDGKITQMKEFMDTEHVTDVICGGQRPAKAA